MISLNAHIIRNLGIMNRNVGKNILKRSLRRLIQWEIAKIRAYPTKMRTLASS
jgi:hypothetical protein